LKRKYWKTAVSSAGKYPGSRAMADVETHSGLSLGSVFDILFFSAGSIYLFGGILIRKFMRGAEGKELIPHYEFWSEIPILIRVSSSFVFLQVHIQYTDMSIYLHITFPSLFVSLTASLGLSCYKHSSIVSNSANDASGFSKHIILLRIKIRVYDVLFIEK
jgi:hypothetical protein